MAKPVRFVDPGKLIPYARRNWGLGELQATPDLAAAESRLHIQAPPPEGIDEASLFYRELTRCIGAIESCSTWDEARQIIQGQQRTGSKVDLAGLVRVLEDLAAIRSKKRNPRHVRHHVGQRHKESVGAILPFVPVRRGEVKGAEDLLTVAHGWFHKLTDELDQPDLTRRATVVQGLEVYMRSVSRNITAANSNQAADLAAVESMFDVMGLVRAERRWWKLAKGGSWEAFEVEGKERLEAGVLHAIQYDPIGKGKRRPYYVNAFRFALYAAWAWTMYRQRMADSGAYARHF